MIQTETGSQCLSVINNLYLRHLSRSRVYLIARSRADLLTVTYFPLSTAQLLSLALCCVTPLSDLKILWQEGHFRDPSDSAFGDGEAGGGIRECKDISMVNSLVRLVTRFLDWSFSGDRKLPRDPSPSSCIVPGLGLSGNSSTSVVST